MPGKTRLGGKRATSAALSYSSGESATPLLGDTIGTNFDATVRRFGGREPPVDRPASRRWTYTELAADVDALALGLLEMGIEKGDRVGIWAPRCAEWTLTRYATAKIGVILSTSTPLTAPASSSSCPISQEPSCS
jgi:fatty-acyl-CoA synthase